MYVYCVCPSVEIVTDNETLLHKELEMLALRTKRVSHTVLTSG